MATAATTTTTTTAAATKRKREKRLREYQSQAMKNFIYGLKSPESRKEYPGRLRLYFDFLGLSGSSSSLDEQAEAFIKKIAGKRYFMG
jgi:hypothetical protein